GGRGKEASQSALARELAARFGPAPDREDEIARWVEDVVEAPHERFRADPSGRIFDEDGRVLARMVRGVGLLPPEVKLAADLEGAAGARLRIQRRLVAWTRDLVERTLEPVRALGRSACAPVRGLAYQLERGLGTARAVDTADALRAIPPDQRVLMDAHGL